MQQQEKMRRPTSLTLRLTLLFGIAAATVFAGFGWVIESAIEHHFLAEDVAELETIANSVSQTLSEHTGVDAIEQRLSDILIGHHRAVLQVIGPQGETLFASPGGRDLATIKPGEREMGSWRDANHNYRVLTLQPSDSRTGDGSHMDGPYTIFVEVAIDDSLRFLDSFRHTLWLMIATGIVVMGLMGWVAVRQGHAPLHSIVARIRLISASEKNTRLRPETMPRELSDLAHSFNDMLGRMEQAFERLANFSADIAHELRTPVTSLLTHSQVALSQLRSVDEYREILYSNVEDYERMAQMIGDMLLLAKTDNGQYELDRVDIDLAQELTDLFDYYEPWAEERGVSLALQGHATVSADQPMLRRVLGNLLSNAIRHTPSGNAVRVQLDHAPGQTVTISVENPGPVIPAKHLSRLFDRFHRVDASRQRNGEGTGLGLAIAKSIVEIHGGKIVALSSTNCTCFRISLPVV